MVQSYEPAPQEFFRPPTLDDLERIAELEVRHRGVRTWMHLHQGARHCKQGAAVCHAAAATACPALCPPPQAAGYPPDEAASRERLEYRLKHGEVKPLSSVIPWSCACLPEHSSLVARMPSLCSCPLTLSQPAPSFWRQYGPRQQQAAQMVASS